MQIVASRSVGDTSKLLGALGLFFLAWGTIAPISTLSWWAQSGNGLVDQHPDLSEDTSTDAPRCYIVFLTGVGDVAAQELADGEAVFLDRLEEALPTCVVVRDVFPYSAVSEDIGGQPLFSWLWQTSQENDNAVDPAGIVLQMRNLWRVALSADGRYGQAYNRGTASTIVERMHDTHPVPKALDDPFQLVLIGTSGGAQVALGAVEHLKAWLPAELTVISMGGVFDGRSGFDHARQVYHYHGSDDWVDNVGSVIFPSRWRWTWSSSFNRARRADRYQAIASGPHEHDGDRGYFGQDLIDDGGQTYLDITIDEMLQLPLWEQLQ
ncbi:MAG: hypothetical protein EA342_11280 [Leptolyngbya sp. LCM1.Bin17]|nr:MAG: hypothetical protein EA342_11280 [Leptolyngbya sp. LCM1.Bin17]